MTCPNCQATTGAKDNFCLRCGAPLRPTESTALATRGEALPTEGGLQEPPSRAEYTYAPRPTSDPISGAAIGPPTERMLGVPGTPPPPAPPDARTYLAPAIFPTAPPRASRIVGLVAVAGAVALLVLAVLAVGWIYTARGYTPSSAQERAVIDAVEANNNAQIAALKTLDVHALDGKMAGQALADNQQMVQILQRQGQYQDARLISIQYSPVRFLSATHATVNTVEQWESTTYQEGSSDPVERQPPQTLHETYYLSLDNGHWIVQQVAIEEEQATPAPGQ